MAKGSFATAINCMDGRIQQPTIDFMKKKFHVDYVDTITEPGPIKALSEKSDITTLDSIKRRVDISVNGHGSKIIAIAGHFDCAGNPLGKNIQLVQLDKAAATVAAWGFGVKILRLWIDDTWTVHVIE